MKGLRKYISPFAPDQSGAAAVLCELGGLVIILDAGGCAGNICGFDEPRWFESKSAIFSAGLRDMDAILGRDDRLVKKIAMACEKIEGEFIAVIGTPVPAVIGTDYKALKRMIEQKTGMPAITIDTDGMELYDVGAGKAYEALFRTFVGKEIVELGAQEEENKRMESDFRCLGILGATPLDVEEKEEGAIRDFYKRQGFDQIFVYGMGDGLEAVRASVTAEKNLVIAPAALKTARYLKKQYGIPYETGYPLETLPEWEKIVARIPELEGKRVLIVHQQILANALRDRIISRVNAAVTVGSWFSIDEKEKKEGDLVLKEEDQWISLIADKQYDVIIADGLFERALSGYEGEYWGLPHFAVSGKRKG